jgi:hypothetical protein
MSGSRRRDWPAIAGTLATLLEAQRVQLYDSFVEGFRKLHGQGGGISGLGHVDPPVAEVVRGELGGKAELALKAYQLLHCSRFVRARSYVPFWRRRAFSKLLSKRMCGSEVRECQAIRRKYARERAEIGEVATHSALTWDVYLYATGRTDAVDPAKPLERPVPTIVQDFFCSWLPGDVLALRFLVATAFDDERTREELAARIAAEKGE